MSSLQTRLENALFSTSSVDQRPLAGRARVVARYVYALSRDLMTGDLNLRAMSLVYTTLLSIVPLIAFALSVLKGLGLHHNLLPLLSEFLRPVGSQAGELAGRLIALVDRLQGRLVGTLGFAVLIFNSMALIQKVEESFNHIWNVPRLRGAGRRVGEYLGVLIVGPVAIVTTFGVASGLVSRSNTQWLREHTSLAPLLATLHAAPPWLLTCLALTFLYGFVPNTHVRGRVALLAGVITGIVWVTAGFVFAYLGAYSTHMMAVYAGFAITLLTLSWLWLSWLILLLGAQLAYYLQNPRYLRTGRRLLVASPRLAERLALSTMIVVGRAYAAGGKLPTPTTLAEQFDVSSGVLTPIIGSLARAGLLKVAADESLAPGRSADSILLGAIVLAVRDGSDTEHTSRCDARAIPEADALCTALEAAIEAHFSARTLQSVLTKAP